MTQVLSVALVFKLKTLCRSFISRTKQPHRHAKQHVPAAAHRRVERLPRNAKAGKGQAGTLALHVMMAFMQHSILVVLVLACWQACQAPAAAAAGPPAPVPLLTARTVNVSTGDELWAALADDSIGVVQLLTDVALATPAIWTPNQPLLRKTDLLIHSICGLHCNPEEYHMVDFGFMAGLMLLNYNVSMRFSSVGISSFRKGAGVGIDFLLGRRGSGIYINDVYFYRLSCSSTAFQSQALQSSNEAPLSGGTSVDVADQLCWRGKCYSNCLHYTDYATEVGPGEPGFSSVSAYGPDTGYHMGITSTARLCYSYWPIDCLNKWTSDQCNEYYSEEVIKELSHTSGTDTIVIAVPVAAGVVVLAAAALAFVLWQKRAARTKAAGGAKGKDVEGGFQDSDGFSSAGPSMGHKRRASWHLVSCHTTPGQAGAVPPGDRVELGVLIGAGSYGKVFRGKWHSSDVAVKVMEHNARMAAVVANEASLMMSFNHPNVVRAYHVMSWRHGPRADAAVQTSAPTSAVNNSIIHNSAVNNSAVNSSAVNNSAFVSGSTAARPETPSVPDVAKCTHDSGIASTADSVQGLSSSSLVPVTATARQGNGAAQPHPGGHSQGVPQQDTGSRLQQGEHSTLQQGGSGACMVVCRSGEGSGGTDQSDGWNGSRNSTGYANDVGSSGRCDGLARTWLIQEFCEGGALADAVRAGCNRQADGKPNMAKVLTQLRDVAAGMRYLHSCKVIHRDLKACNVLLATDPAAPFGQVAKVADFGLSRILQQGKSQFSTRTLGTISHMSPELLRAGKQSLAAVVYAFGVVMWELVVGRAPFDDTHYGAVFERVAIHGERPALSPELAEAVGEEYMLLMQLCWHAEAAMRPTFQQVCEALELMLRHYRQISDDGGHGRYKQGSSGDGAAGSVRHSSVRQSSAGPASWEPVSMQSAEGRPTGSPFVGEWDL